VDNVTSTTFPIKDGLGDSGPRLDAILLAPIAILVILLLHVRPMDASLQQIPKSSSTFHRNHQIDIHRNMQIT
jgi:hypothetical protein